MDTKKVVVFEHNCPVCHYMTKEAYEKTTFELSVTRRTVESYVFKSIITGTGKHKFERFRIDRWFFVSCPQCGTVLNADVCEKVISIEEALPED